MDTLNGFDLAAVPISFWFLFASIISLWLIPFWQAWSALFATALIAGFAESFLHWPAIPFILWAGLTCFWLGQRLFEGKHYQQLCNSRPRLARSLTVFANISFIALAIGLGSHKLPGFDSYSVVRGLQLHQEAPETGIRFHFDKAVIGFFYLVFCVTLIRGLKEWANTLKQTALVVAGSIAGAFIIGRLFGYVTFDPVFSSYFFAFLLANLLVTSVAEEAIFRGWIQRGLSRRWVEKKNGDYLALGVTSVLFGLAHLWGGIGLFIGATLAGLGYGYAYMKTQRLEAAIVAHFAFNGIHFTFFTYPYWTPTTQ